MPIPLGEDRAAGSPVLKRRQIGESFVGGLIDHQQRDLLKEGQPVRKDNGKFRQELVVTLLTYQSNMATSLGDIVEVPQRGQVVRVILKGGAFGQWIEGVNAMKKALNRQLQVGDLIQMTTTHATRYESTGQNRELGDITTAEELDQYYATSMAYRDRRESLGFRGGLDIQACPDSMAQFVVECEAAYVAANAMPLPDDVQQAPPDWAQQATGVPAPVQQPMASGYVDPRAPQPYQQPVQQQPPPQPFNPTVPPPAPLPVPLPDQEPFPSTPAAQAIPHLPNGGVVSPGAATAPAVDPTPPPATVAPVAQEPNPLDGLFGS